MTCCLMDVPFQYENFFFCSICPSRIFRNLGLDTGLQGPGTSNLSVLNLPDLSPHLIYLCISIDARIFLNPFSTTLQMQPAIRCSPQSQQTEESASPVCPDWLGGVCCSVNSLLGKGFLQEIKNCIIYGKTNLIFPKH